MVLGFVLGTFVRVLTGLLGFRWFRVLFSGLAYFCSSPYRAFWI